MATPDDCHSGLGFGGIWLATCILELDFPVTLAARLGDGVSGMQLTPGSQHTAYTVPQPKWALCGHWLRRASDLFLLSRKLHLETKLSGLVWGAVLLCVPATVSLGVSEEGVCTEKEHGCFNVLTVRRHPQPLYSRAKMLVFIQGRVQSLALGSGGSWCMSWDWSSMHTPFLGGFPCSDPMCN